MSIATALVMLVGFLALYLLLWMAALKNGKKRKIGLTLTSYLSLFFTPLVGCLVALFTKKIDKTREYPTYKQRLPYENTTAMLIAAILYILFGLLAILFWMISVEKYAYLVNSGILFYGAYILFEERENLLSEKADPSADEDSDTHQKLTERISDSYKPDFVFVSNVQNRIAADNSYKTARSLRRIEVKSGEIGGYLVSITDDESGQPIMQQIVMHKVSYSDIDECLSLNDATEEYTLNVFYKNGQVYKCTVFRKSKNTYIHYFNE